MTELYFSGPTIIVSSNCSHCGASNATSRCSDCKVPRYCSTACQQLQWPEHAKICKVFVEQRERVKNVPICTENLGKRFEGDDAELVATIKQEPHTSAHLCVRDQRKRGHVEKKHMTVFFDEDSDALSPTGTNYATPKVFVFKDKRGATCFSTCLSLLLATTMLRQSARTFLAQMFARKDRDNYFIVVTIDRHGGCSIAVGTS